MVRNVEYLAMKTDQTNSAGVEKLDSDLKEFRLAAKKLVSDAVKLGGLGFGTNLIQWFASFAAIYLLVLDRTNWKTNMLTSLLLPYIFLSLPSVLFSFLSGEVGKWIAFIAVVLRLFFPSRFPEWLDMPASLILLLVVAPSFCSDTLRKSLAGLIICLAIGCYLLHQHINASGGFRNSFTKTHGVSNSIGIILLMVYPLWAFVVLSLSVL